MNREIRFRGKNEDTGEWVYGYFVKDTSGNCLIESGLSLGYEGYDYVFVKSETVGEFTGLTDKNGVEIFEGDLVKVVKKENGNIKYYIEPFKLGEVCRVCRDNRYTGFELVELEYADYSSSIGNFRHEDMLEVVGNIYNEVTE